jgi:hypothetical protein
MAVLKRDRAQLSTGAPLPPPVWQMLCEFANGSCACAATGAARPCQSVEVAAARIRNRVLLDIAGTPAARRAAP